MIYLSYIYYMKETIIYTLTDPRNNIVKYIGITSSKLSTRLSHHCTVLKGNNYKINWIKKLKRLNLKPVIEKLDICSTFEEALYFERYWIKQFKSWGFNLVNSTEGGEGALGYKHTQKSIKKMKYIQAQKPKKSKVIKMNKNEQSNYISIKLSKPLIEYDLKGNFVKEWNSQLDASKHYNIQPSTIGHALKDLNRIANNSFWRRKTNNDILLSISINPYIGNKKNLYVLNIITNELQFFKSNMDAFKVIGRPTNPSKYINKKNLFKKQFKLYNNDCHMCE